MNQNQIYQMIEDNIINQLKNGKVPWRRCYHVKDYGAFCRSHKTGKPYSLLNQFLLTEPGEYWTFKQIQEAGYRLKRGSSSHKIVFWSFLEVRDRNRRNVNYENQDDRFKLIPYLKYYNVFHESDIEGLPVNEPTDAEEEKRIGQNMESIEEAEAIIMNYLSANPDISMVTADRTPCFSPARNLISMPQKSQFDSLFDFYGTAFHEIIHSTARKVKREVQRGREGYAREELVAEIGSAFLCGYAGIREEDVIKNNAAYCANWLTALKDNIKNLVWASSRAEKAANYVVNKNETVDEKIDQSEVA
jgi:antirestriction protein ArdC